MYQAQGLKQVCKRGMHQQKRMLRAWGGWGQAFCKGGVVTRGLKVAVCWGYTCGLISENP